MDEVAHHKGCVNSSRIVVNFICCQIVNQKELKFSSIYTDFSLKKGINRLQNTSKYGFIKSCFTTIYSISALYGEGVIPLNEPKRFVKKGD